MDDIKTYLFRKELEKSFNHLITLKYFLEQNGLVRDIEVCDSMLDRIVELLDKTFFDY